HKYGEYPGSIRVERVPQKPKPALSPAAKVLPDPVSLTAHRGQVGKAFLFSITGRTAVPYVGPIPEIGEPREYAAGGGNVWGSDIYTDDSTLAVAAVHAGVLQDGQTGIVKVTILPGRDSYTGSTRNGVTTHDYGAWAGSYWVEKGPEDPAVTPALPPGVNVQPDPGSLSQVRMQPLYFRVTGTTTGSVWGSDIYTDDSSLATAAVHAGALRDGETGIVKVTLAPGRNSYAGSARHGVTTREYGEYPGSFRVERALPVDDDGRRAGANSTIVLPD
ncbi:MAG: LCCL domain-containing protein, partial [Planctomycetaceae bacterium]